MNKRGNAFLGVSIGIFIFIIGVIIIPYLTDDITTARDNLSCSTAESLTGGQMVTCLMFSAITPYVILFFCSLAIGYFVGGLK